MVFLLLLLLFSVIRVIRGLTYIFGSVCSASYWAPEGACATSSVTSSAQLNVAILKSVAKIN